jgi:predicted dehydrogenase
LVISTPDALHYAQAVRALDLGYDILLEKPIAVTEAECVAIGKKAAKLGRTVAVCHVLRYTAFYRGIKDVIDSGRIGAVAAITQTENVSYWHQAHSYVRGNWRSSKTSSPMILAKCCHDLDILCWLAGAACKSVSSYGSLGFFKSENAPQNSGGYCCDCGVRKTCPYDWIKFYKANPGWFNAVRRAVPSVDDADASDEIEKALSNKGNPYSRCVFRCDNDAVDRQAVNILFDGGVTAQLMMTAFSALCTRRIKVHGTYGEIEGDFEEKSYRVTEYGKPPQTVDVTKVTSDFSGHGGGDRVMFWDFIDLVGGRAGGKGLTTLDKSVLSHRMAFAAERSRLHNGKPVSF